MRNRDMKRVIIASAFMFVILNLFSFVSAQGCNPQINLLNQDPYPGIPGEYVKLVFEISGLTNAECGNVRFELIDDYPIKFDKGVEKSTILSSGNYASNYNSNILVPFFQNHIYQLLPELVHQNIFLMDSAPLAY